MHEKFIARTPWCSLLLCMIWLGGCRQIPLAPDASSKPSPQESQPSQASSRDQDLRAPIAASSASRIERSVREEPTLLPGNPSPSTQHRQQVEQPLGGRQAYWLQPSAYPEWLGDCLAPHQLDHLPRIQRSVMPRYPARLHNEGVPGNITILFKISPQGKLAHYMASPGAHPELVQSSVQAMRHWKFGIASFKGQAASVCYIQRFRFVVE